MSEIVSVPTTQAQSTDLRLSNSQELCLDLVRICMAQLIVVEHFVRLSRTTSWLSKITLDGLRVTVFFMLSGFLIFATTWRRRDKAFTFRDYLIERSARLWVCLVPALAFSAGVAYVTIDRPDYPATDASGPLQFIGNLLMLEDYPLFQILRRVGIDSEYFIRPYATAEPYWTLPIEYFLYVGFGFAFFYGYLRRGRPSWPTLALFVFALGAVLYHGATGWGQCLSLVWIIGALGPWAVPVERNLQQRFGYSDRAAVLIILGWLGTCLLLMALRALSRGINFYELQMAVFLAAFLLGLIWLTGRIKIDVAPRFSKAARTIAKQTYALYLTHNAVLTLCIAYTGLEFTLLQGIGLLIACNLVAIPFYLFFDRHHKAVAEWLKSPRWLTIPVWLSRSSVALVVLCSAAAFASAAISGPESAQAQPGSAPDEKADAAPERAASDHHPAGYGLAFADEFDGQALDRNQWCTRYIYAGGPALQLNDAECTLGAKGTLDFLNDEAQRYRDLDSSGKPLHEVAGGVLTLSAVKGAGAAKYEAGMIRSKKLFKPDETKSLYITARVRLPSVKGTWPAFWLNSDRDERGNLAWPPEIDIFEAPLNGVEDRDTMLKIGAVTRGANKQRMFFMHPSFSERWRNYHSQTSLRDVWIETAVEWTHDSVCYFLDGTKLMCEDYRWVHEDGRAAPPAHVLLNIAVGGSWAGRHGIDDVKFPARFSIEYVRVYERVAAR